MINKVRITNMNTKENLLLSKDGEECFVIETLDWGSPEILTKTYKMPYQIGESVSGKNIGVRHLLFIGYIISDKLQGNNVSWNEYLYMQEQNVQDKKDKMNKVCNINDELLIEVGEYKLLACMSNSVRYGTQEEENNEVLCAFSLQMDCFKPMFFKNEIMSILASVKKKLHFPLVLKQNKIVLGEIEKRKSYEIENKGDIDVGCIIKLIAKGGSVANPKVYNVETEEYFELANVVIPDGGYIIINTVDGEEDVYMYNPQEGTTKTLIGNIVKGSVFFKIKRGKWYYSYVVDEESINNINVSISFVEQYVNIRGM